MVNGAHPAGTTGSVKVMYPSEVCALFFNANVLLKILLVRSTGEDSVFSYAHLREGDNERFTEVEVAGVIGRNPPGNSDRAGRVDLRNWCVELQGRDEGEGEEECATTMRSIFPSLTSSGNLSQTYLSFLNMLESEVSAREKGKSDQWDDDTRVPVEK